MNAGIYSAASASGRGPVESSAYRLKNWIQ